MQRCGVPHDPHSNRHLEDNTSSSRSPGNGAPSSANQKAWAWNAVVGSLCHCWRDLCRPLPMVCYSMSSHWSLLSFAPEERHDLATDYKQYNYLSQVLEEPPKQELLLWLARLAFIGFVASVVSDSVSNSIRVVKTYRQVNEERISYCKSSTCNRNSVCCV